MSRIRANQITNQSADGAPTVQNGLVISGVTTSTTFSGSGASLTNIPSAQLTGALPALDGSNLTGIAADKIFEGNTEAEVVDTGSDGHFKVTTEGSERFRITSDGKVGINETSPPWPLSIRGAVSGGTVSGGAGVFIGIQDNFAAIQMNTASDAHGCIIDMGYSGDDYKGRIEYINGDDYMRFNTNGGERLRINSNGAVGINTVVSDQPNTPSLHLHGSAGDDCRISFSTPTKSNPGSRIGYYGLNRFGIDTYDGIEMRDVTRSYATIFKIDNNGYMTNNQPYGEVRFNTHNDTGGEQKQTNVYTHTVHNGMAHSSGRLTVPATGKYYIGIHGNILDDAGAAQYLYINGSKTDGFRWQMSDSTSSWKSSMVGGVKPLNANDYLEVYVTGKQDNQAWNIFTVYMLG